MSVKSKGPKLRKSLFPSSKPYLSEELKETYFEELFSENSILNNRLKPITKEDRETRTKSERPDGLVKARVTRKYESETWELYRVLFLNVETYDTLEIKGTPEHPFWVVKPEGIDGKGRWIPIRNLEIGFRCVSSSGDMLQVLEKEYLKLDEPVKVYNLEVEGAHTYFVGKNGQNVLVHNQCGGTDEINGNPIGKAKNAPVIFDMYAVAYWGFWRHDGTAYTDAAIANTLGYYKIPNIYPDMSFAGKAVDMVKDQKDVGVCFSGNGIYDSSPNSPKYVGTSGMGTCIAVITFSPETGQRTVFHFAQTEAAQRTLVQKNFPQDSVAVIAGASGGNITTRNQMLDILRFFKNRGIEVQGYVPGTDAGSIFVDRSGNWIVVPTQNYIDFMNSPPSLLPIN